MMNDKGRKHLRERDRTGQVTTTNHYLNMDENQVEAFENEWLGMGRSIGFQAPPRDMNQLPFPRPQLAQGSYAPIRRSKFILLARRFTACDAGGKPASRRQRATPIYQHSTTRGAAAARSRAESPSGLWQPQIPWRSA